MSKKTINRMILATWILLFSCFIFKIFSNDLFEIMISNEKFIEITTEQETMIADCIIRKELKGNELYNAIGYSKRQTINIRKRIFNKLK